MCRITICRQKSEFLTDRPKISRFAENVVTRGKWPRPLGRRVACFARKPLLVLSLQYCLLLHVVKTTLALLKTTFRQIAHVINFWQIMSRQIDLFFWPICWKFHMTHFSTQTFSTNCTDAPFTYTKSTFCYNLKIFLFAQIKFTQQ